MTEIKDMANSAATDDNFLGCYELNKMLTLYKAYLERQDLRYAVLKLLDLHESDIFQNDIPRLTGR